MGRASSPPYTRDSFKPPWNEPFNWHLDQDGQYDPRCRRSIVLYGVAGTGKTCRALCEFERPLICHCIEDVREVIWAGPRKTTHLVFDEADFTKLDPEVCINLLDSEQIHTLPARYEVVKFPPIPRVFVTNRPMRWGIDKGHIFPPGVNADQQDAILRRFKSLHVTEPLYNLVG